MCTFEIDKTERLIIIIGMVVSVLGIAIFMAFKASRKETMVVADPPEINYQYNVFLSAAMASLNTQEEYEDLRKWILKIKVLLNNLGYKKTFYAAEDLADKNQFDDPGLAAKDDIKAIDISEYFMFIYPAKTTTSAIMELGYALAKNKKIWVFVRNREDLPYLAQGLDSVYDNVKITTYDNPLHFENLLKNSHLEIFS